MISLSGFLRKKIIITVETVMGGL